MTTGNDSVQAAVVLWNGGPEALKELVEALAAWYSGVGAAGTGDDAGVEGEDVGDENDEGDGGDEGAPDDDGGDEDGETPDEDAGDGEEDEPQPTKRPRGAKPTPEEISDWAERADAGESISSIARSCGRSISQVHRAVRKGRE